MLHAEKGKIEAKERLRYKARYMYHTKICTIIATHRCRIKAFSSFQRYVEEILTAYLQRSRLYGIEIYNRQTC